MKIEKKRVGSIEVLAPDGPLVDDDAREFSNELLRKLRSSNHRVVVSLEDVPYLDSLALEGLLDAADELSDRSVRLKLAKVPSTCREVLELTGLADRFQFFDEEQDAAKSFL